MVIINKGQTLIEGEVKELLNKDGDNITISYKSEKKLNSIISNSVFKDCSFEIENSNLNINLSEEIIPELITILVKNEIQIFSVERKKSLEDYFLRITDQA